MKNWQVLKKQLRSEKPVPKPDNTQKYASKRLLQCQLIRYTFNDMVICRQYKNASLRFASLASLFHPYTAANKLRTFPRFDGSRCIDKSIQLSRFVRLQRTISHGSAKNAKRIAAQLHFYAISNRIAICWQK